MNNSEYTATKKPITLIEHKGWPKDTKPIVSVFSWVYNHKDFIRESIESILMQKTTFPVEIIIHDDASDDGTLEIIKEYEDRYPHLFKNILQNENQWSQGKSVMTPLIELPKGKYIALTHGDDYWTDPLKLQKQVDFLEYNESYSLCCHANEEVQENGERFDISNQDIKEFSLPYVLKHGWFIRTASMLFRKNILDDGYPDFFHKSYSADYILQIMILKKGNGRYFNDIMSAYRNHPGGVSNSNLSIVIKRMAQKLDLLNNLNTYTLFKYKDEISFHQNSIKQAVSFNLIRYPYLLNDLGLNFYLTNLNILLGAKVILQKIKKNIFKSF